jgi:hypothetical protein
MTLKEKFKKEGFSNYDYLSNVADDFAIGFGEWLLNSSYFFNIGMKEMTFEQVLEIYKKEKGL